VAIGAVVVGTGFGCVTHVRALRAAGFDVRALVGRSPERTQARAAAFGVDRACRSLDEALALPGVEAVTIATPPSTHAALALEAIADGRHVICEKPFARDAAEGRLVLAAAEAAGVVHLMGTEFRYDPGQATLARAVAEGAVGLPRMITVLLHVPTLVDADDSVPAWWSDENEGGGWLGAHGSQVIDQIRVTAGEFARVSAGLLHVVDREMSADDGFVVQFRLTSGALGLIETTCADRGPMSVVTRVAGSHGAAWIDGLGDQVWIADRKGVRPVSVDADLPPIRFEPLPAGMVDTAYERMIAHGLDLASYTRLAEVFRALISGEAPPPGPEAATFADGVAGMEVLDAIRRSARSKRWEDVGGE
jgi:predicted dehydrogenase